MARKDVADIVSGDGIGTVLHINRSIPFNPAEFIGQGWSIWKGPANSDGLSGTEDQDERSLALTELDLAQVRFETCLRDGEPYISGEEKLRRLKEAGFIRLDAKIFQYLWEHKDKIPESWKERVNGNIRYIFFDGTILRGPRGRRSVLCLVWRGGEWCWGGDWLGNVWDSNCPSAVLAILPAEA